MENSASAVWRGSLKEGSGEFSAKSGVFTDIPYSFSKRFEGAPGANPEELIAAAHASCFSMAFSAELGKLGITPEEISTTATVALETVDGRPTVTKSHLNTSVRAHEADRSKLEAAAEAAKGCPISRLVNAQVTLDLAID